MSATRPPPPRGPGSRRLQNGRLLTKRRGRSPPRSATRKSRSSRSRTWASCATSSSTTTAAFKREGYPSVNVELVLSPAWTTDWMSESGKAKLQEYGIAPPSGHSNAMRHAGPVRLSLAVKCPQCSSLNTKELTRFGSTSCKALYVCQECKEPFDYFKVL